MNQQPCTATTCNRTLHSVELDAGQVLCTPCLRLIEAWLTELPRQIVVLEGSRQRETTGAAGGRSAYRTPPLPGRDDILNLLGPAAWSDGIRDPYGQAAADQHGPLPIAGTLIIWVRLITETRRWNPPATLTPQALAAWLNRPQVLDWASRQPWAGTMRDELHAMICLVRRTTHLRPQRRPIPQPCPRCDSLCLVDTEWEAHIECTACESLFSRDELALAARIQIAELQTGTAA